jgi:hypothetical protein
MKTRILLLPALLIANVSFTSQAQQPVRAADDVTIARSSQPAKRRITLSLTSNERDGALLVISSSQSLADHVTYRSGDKVYFIFPQSSAMQGSVSGFGFVDARLEQREEDVVFSFRLEHGQSPRITVLVNRLEVGLDSHVSAIGNDISKTLASDDVSKVSAQPTSFTRSLATSHVSQPAASSSPPVTPGGPQVATPLNFLPAREKIKEVEIDLSVPESPGFTVLGLTPQTVIRPTTPREFATSLLNGVDDKGNFQSGIAIDTVPYLLFFGNDLTLEQYRKSFGTQLLSRTQLSLATTKGTGDQDKSVRLALGLHATIFDKGDPRKDRLLTQCFTDKLSFPPMDPAMSIDEREEFLKNERVKLLATYKERIEECRQLSRDRNWNASSLVFGAAPSWISPTGDTSKLNWNGGGVWMSLAYGFENVERLKKAAQLIFHTRYRNRERVADSVNKGKFIIQDSFYAGLRFRVGKPDFAGSLESTYLREMTKFGKADDLFKLSFGAEKKLSNNLWLQFSIGGEGGRRDGKGQLFVLSSFKYAFSRERTFEDRFSKAVQQ